MHFLPCFYHLPVAKESRPGLTLSARWLCGRRPGQEIGMLQQPGLSPQSFLGGREAEQLKVEPWRKSRMVRSLWALLPVGRLPGWLAADWANLANWAKARLG